MSNKWKAQFEYWDWLEPPTLTGDTFRAEGRFTPPEGRFTDSMQLVLVVATASTVLDPLRVTGDVRPAPPRPKGPGRPPKGTHLVSFRSKTGLPALTEAFSLAPRQVHVEFSVLETERGARA